MADQPAIVEKTKDFLNDEEHTLGEKAPGTPFLLVGLSYLVVLLIACGVMALLYSLSSTPTP